MFWKKLGKNPQGGKTYENLEPTELVLSTAAYFRILREYSNKPKLVTPSRALPTRKTNLHELTGNELEVVWFGHSSYMIVSNGYRILVDPVLFGPASPFSSFGKGFAGTDIYTLDDIPEIDLLILTHDHYDHLSYETVIALKSKVKKIVVPSGVGSHFVYWGFDKNTIHELDWNQLITIDPTIHLTALPARHFSGRYIPRNKTLWASFVLQLHDYKIFIGGDSGYGTHFKKIGEMHGPFDLAFLECGQYGKEWPLIHMFPPQTMQAAKDIDAKILLPVHFGKFVLSVHQWNDSIKKLVRENNENISIAFPMIGEKYTPGKEVENKEWWNFE